MNYYNEIDLKAAAWIQELINDDLIPDGKIDTRSIVDVQPGDLAGFTQCHFFCGIAGWSRALRIAGWPDDREIWTGSCPCQSFSCAGKQKGVEDPRHLWPHFFRLVKQCRPNVVTGEQVEAAIRHGWLDGIQADLEAENYTVGHCVLGAHSINAPHIRQRLYWVANAQSRGLGEHGSAQGITGHAEQCGEGCGMGEPIQSRLEGHSRDGDNGSQSGRNGTVETGSVAEAGESGGVEDSGSDVGKLSTRKRNGPDEADSSRASSEPPGRSAFGFWSDSTWHLCRDGKSRRIPAGSQHIFQRMADEFSEGMDPVRIASHGFPLAPKIQGRAALLKGYGNAIVPELAAEFVRAVMQEI